MSETTGAAPKVGTIPRGDFGARSTLTAAIARIQAAKGLAGIIDFDKGPAMTQHTEGAAPAQPQHECAPGDTITRAGVEQCRECGRPVAGETAQQQARDFVMNLVLHHGGGPLSPRVIYSCDRPSPLDRLDVRKATADLVGRQVLAFDDSARLVLGPKWSDAAAPPAPEPPAQGVPQPAERAPEGGEPSFAVRLAERSKVEFHASAAPLAPPAPVGQDAEPGIEVSVVCRACGTLMGGVEAGSHVRWVTCSHCEAGAENDALNRSGQDADEAWLAAEVDLLDGLSLMGGGDSREDQVFRTSADRYRRILARLRATRGAGQAPAECAHYCAQQVIGEGPGGTCMCDARTWEADELAPLMKEAADALHSGREVLIHGEFWKGRDPADIALALEHAATLVTHRPSLAAPAGEQGEALAAASAMSLADARKLVEEMFDAVRIGQERPWSIATKARAEQLIDQVLAALQRPAAALRAPAPAPVEGALREALARECDEYAKLHSDFDGLWETAKVLAEFAQTAPGRLPQRVQDAIAATLTPEAPR